MPELPEVQTTVNYLKKSVTGRKVLDIWTDTPKFFRGGFGAAKNKIRGKKIISVSRRGKYVVFDFQGDSGMLIHQKMSGHLLVGRWKKEKARWIPVFPKTLNDPMNRFIHVIFYLSGGLEMALSDLRKFAKIVVFKDEKLNEVEDIKKLGPDPLVISFKKFAEILKRKKGRIKTVLMDQGVIAGIGNIYSDEILWYSGIHPLKRVEKLSVGGVKKIYQATKKVLRLALKQGGTSSDDYRKPDGTKGGYYEARKVYQREGEKCSRDNGIIKRIKIGGRSAHFCPKHQKLLR